jgi:uncharacterized protein (TIGR02145 family)
LYVKYYKKIKNMRNLLLLLCFVLFSCSDEIVKDIDGNIYNTVDISDQTWTTSNLNVSKYRNGDVIPQVTDPTEWSQLTSGAWCYYNNDPENGKKYGKLYNWYAVTDPRGLAPIGYHIPAYFEWGELINYLDSNARGGETSPNLAGGKMKETGNKHWNSPNTDATNDSGFSGLPGGWRNHTVGGTFYGIGTQGLWWCSTEGNQAVEWAHSLDSNSGTCINLYGYDSMGAGASVRCVKD